MNFTIKVSKAIFWFLIIGGILLLPVVGMGLIFIIVAFFLRSKKIEIVGMDAKYHSWFSNITIKQVESVDVFYIPFLRILNTVTVTGRGSAKIRIRNVGNIHAVREFADKFDELKHENR